MKKITFLLSTLSILFCGITLSYGKQSVSAEAKRHFDRGLAALEMASSTEDYAPAIKEFEQAVSLAPDWPDAYYQLAMVQEKTKKYSAAVKNLKQYLKLAPNASDTEAVKSLINKLEYKREQEEEVKRVYEMMASGRYERKEISHKKLSGKESIWVPLETFRIVAGKMQVSNHWYVAAAKHGGYHPKQHPPIPREWEPVKVNGRFYEYTYLYYMDMFSNYGGYVAQIDNEVKGEIISIDPPRVKEIAKQSVDWGAPIERNKNPWIINDNYNVVTEYIYELIANQLELKMGGQKGQLSSFSRR
ncbi:MAG: tetratricopeptide repeat protein [Candidatus Omnitrophica bacterium]|nr:tetratricopeptide repeat protein [Candidatus Omnitrophota bacterium]